MADPKKPVIDEIIVAINNALGLDERDKGAISRLRHLLAWYTTDAARAPRPVKITMTGRLATSAHGVRTLTLPDGQEVDFDFGPDTEGVLIEDLD